MSAITPIRPPSHSYGYGYATGALKTAALQLERFEPAAVDYNTRVSDLLLVIGELELVLQSVRQTVTDALSVTAEIDAAIVEWAA